MSIYHLKDKTIEISDQELEDLITQQKNRKMGLPAHGERYYYLDDWGGIHNTELGERPVADTCRWSIGNLFVTKELAQKHLAKLRAHAKIEKFIKEHGLEFVGGKYSTKYYVLAVGGKLAIGSHFEHINAGIPFCFRSDEDARLVMETCREEWKVLLGDETNIVTD